MQVTIEVRICGATQQNICSAVRPSLQKVEEERIQAQQLDTGTNINLIRQYRKHDLPVQQGRHQGGAIDTPEIAMAPHSTPKI